MPTPIETFFSAWGVADAEDCARAIAPIFAPVGTYADPRSPEVLTGTEAVAAYVAMFGANAPGWTATLVTTSTVAGVTRATVAFGGMGPDGTQMVQHGQYFVEEADGMITRMVGFAGIGAPE
ncbi:MAG: nuclear transport factor 2 family protein [Pseudomonadota bacterium]